MHKILIQIGCRTCIHRELALSSPVASIANWRSPVLFVHGDDDRNVPFQQTTDLVGKLRTQNVAFEAIGSLSAQPSEYFHRSGDQQSCAHSAPTSRSTRATRALRHVPLSLNL